MKRILIEVQYNGRQFSGWQVQNKKRTVEGELEKILSDFLREKIVLHASGRTDSGVHAKSQFAHFDSNSKMNFERLPQALQKLLPSDISIISAKIVPDNFHARYCVKSKTYHYMCYISNIRDIFLDETAMQVKTELDMDKMRSAITYLIGQHDFTSFCTAKKDMGIFDERKENLQEEILQKKKTNIRTIYNFELDRQGNIITFKITGNGFLHNMVRIIVGTLIEVGQGRIEPEEISEILKKKNRIYAGKTAKPNGLMLYNVEY